MTLQDQVVSFIGKLSGFSRAEAIAQARDSGASVTSTVTKRTTILVAADEHTKAPNGVQVWSEATFVAQLSQAKGDPEVEPPAAMSTSKPKRGKKGAKVKDDAIKDEGVAKAAPKGKAKGDVVTPVKSKKRAKKGDPVAPPSPKKPKTEEVKADRVGARKPDRHLSSREQFAIVDDYLTDLMQSNLGANNNKFYIIQLLQSLSDQTYYVFTRWGRLGEAGQQKLAPCGHDLDKAIKQFETKFADKTRNQWGDRREFVKYANKYQLVELDTSETGDGGAGDAAMGKLSAAQIQKGQVVLESLKAAITSRTSARAIEQLSGEYYSLIPTLAGRNRPPPLSTKSLVEEKEALLDFWLRMGFDDMEEQTGLAPIEGIMDLPLPSTLIDAASVITQDTTLTLYFSRSENRTAIRKYFNYLRVFLEAMCRMPQKEQTLWRGVSVDLFDAYEPGKVITWWGVSSCTSDENVARNFMRSCGGSCTLLRVRCKTAMDISVLSMFPGEKECLLAPGTQLKVVKRTRNGNIAEIEVEEVGRAI
ncbi:hypothetical protein DYB26_003371 [Aphanomyces astaci]|uniref:NAD(P)(+)--arginine ADP-ribosyltransferase n=1 Tax=Aphanomyces astaci TaxID=112090 RepID=A0A3R6XJ82_APHAT|nr:hypothetical protein DYB26_003371 [Aphanomyces astaci]